MTDLYKTILESYYQGKIDTLESMVDSFELVSKRKPNIEFMSISDILIMLHTLIDNAKEKQAKETNNVLTT